jgi:hypothetical protein
VLSLLAGLAYSMSMSSVGMAAGANDVHACVCVFLHVCVCVCRAGLRRMCLSYPVLLELDTARVQKGVKVCSRLTSLFV